MELKSRVAVVTGGATRIGRAITQSLAKAGCSVFIHYHQAVQAAEQLSAEIEVSGGKSSLYSADLRDIVETQSIIPAAIETFGTVDILINNAGIFPENDTFSKLNSDSWDTIMAVCLRAPFLLSRAFSSQKTSADIRKIININDARVSRPEPNHFAYRLAKRGLGEMTTLLALELAPQITVNTLALGAILPPPNKDQDYMNDLARNRIPLQRTGNLEIVGDNILHLLRQDFLTGTTTTLDGGEFI